MKKYILLALTLLFALTQIETVEAQFRPFEEPIAVPNDDGGNPNSPQTNSFQPIIDGFGNPICCEDGGSGWSFDLSFGSFSTISFLQTRIAAETARRSQMIDWLRNQENTSLLQEINRQMGTNHSNFAIAQKEYFKFYDSGGNGNGGVVARARDLSTQESQKAVNWTKKRNENIVDHISLDSWIKCGFCSEFAGLVIDAADGPARNEAIRLRDETAKDFGDAYYLNGFHKSMSKGIYNIIDNGILLNRLSDIRVQQYRNLGWEDRVLQMSAYLVNYNLRGSCSILTGGNCLPADLAPYRPSNLWNNPTILAWGREFAPSIPRAQLIFSAEYAQNLIDAFNRTGNIYFLNEFNKIKRDKEDLLDAFRLPENSICGNIKWRKIASANYANLTDLRIISVQRFLGVPVPWTERRLNLRDICVEIPNFRMVNGQRITITQAQASTNFKIAWEAALYSLIVDFQLNDATPTEENIAGLFLANLNLMLTSQRPGSLARYGACFGSVPETKTKFCAD